MGRSSALFAPFVVSVTCDYPNRFACRARLSTNKSRCAIVCHVTWIPHCCYRQIRQMAQKFKHLTCFSGIQTFVAPSTSCQKFRREIIPLTMIVITIRNRPGPFKHYVISTNVHFCASPNLLHGLCRIGTFFLDFGETLRLRGYILRDVVRWRRFVASLKSLFEAGSWTAKPFAGLLLGWAEISPALENHLAIWRSIRFLLLIVLAATSATRGAAVGNFAILFHRPRWIQLSATSIVATLSRAAYMINFSDSSSTWQLYSLAFHRSLGITTPKHSSTNPSRFPFDPYLTSRLSCSKWKYVSVK